MKKKDWFENQIENIGKSLAVALFGKEVLKKTFDNLKESEENTANPIDDIYKKATLDSLINAKEITKAENYVFEFVNKNKTSGNLLLAILFYNKLLDSGLISEEHARESLNKLRQLYNE